MNKNLKHIKEHTEFVDAERLLKVYLTDAKQISCSFTDLDVDGKVLKFRGSIQKIYNDKNGEAIGYDVYIY
jgi:hypothetical protein